MRAYRNKFYSDIFTILKPLKTIYIRENKWTIEITVFEREQSENNNEKKKPVPYACTKARKKKFLHQAGINRCSNSKEFIEFIELRRNKVNSCTVLVEGTFYGPLHSVQSKSRATTLKTTSRVFDFFYSFLRLSN